MSRPRRNPAAPRQRLVVGIHPVRELLRAGRPVVRLMVATSRSDTAAVDELVALAQAAGVAIDVVDRAELDERAPDMVHQGVVAFAPPLPSASIEDLVAAAEHGNRPALLVALDGVTDPHNVGSIARTAEAAGAHGLLLPARRTASITPTVEKAAAGALAHLPIATVTNLVRALELLRDHGVWSLGLDGSAATLLEDQPLAEEPCVLVIGAEGSGLSRLTRERCDALVRLPMRGAVSSLNASVAAGIALYAIAARQEARTGQHPAP